MQYETIILELMSRIKVLEEDASSMKATLQTLGTPENSVGDSDTPSLAAPTPVLRNTIPYTKMTEHMMDGCYTYGKKAYHTLHANTGVYAAIAANETHMNRSSAFMYIYAVKSMLEGKVFKRAVSTKALRKYFSEIYKDFGKAGLSNAIAATRAHIEYRESCKLPANSMIAVCDEFEKKI